MPPPAANDGWLAQLVYLGSIALAGLVAWVSQYRLGRRDDPREPASRHVVLESAEIADMHAVRAISPALVRIADQMQQTFQIVQENRRIIEDNHRIVEQNREMLTILQRIDRAYDVQAEVRERQRQEAISDFLASQREGEGVRSRRALDTAMVIAILPMYVTHKLYMTKAG